MLKTRNYAALVYPDSAPENWIDVLANEFVPAFVSPLHNLDKNPTGELKKPHYHVVIMFDGPKIPKLAEEFFAKIAGIGCKPVQSIRGYVRYLCHLDNPEKAPYDPTEVLCFSGADYYETINLVTDKYKSLREIQSYCNDANLTSFSDLIDFCSENRSDWFRILADNTIFIKEYLKSKQWTSSHR